MNSIVIGYGLAGRRHVRILKKIGHCVSIVSRHESKKSGFFKDIKSAFAQNDIKYAVIANETSSHYHTCLELVRCGFHGKVLVEKPLFYKQNKIPGNRFESVFVAYNLRFHPVLIELKKWLAKKKIMSAIVYAGQYLPDWRPKNNYTKGYSAKKHLGGGVLNDLSHEIDYINWLFGPIIHLTALGGHLSSLKIDSDDAYSLLMTAKKCPLVTAHINYLDRIKRREIIVNADGFTVNADLVKNSLTVNGKQRFFTVLSDETYVMEHKTVLTKASKLTSLCSLREGLEVIDIIEAAKKASSKRMWIKL